jgi:pyrimidine-nucleoside phosphorylase
LRVYDLILKKRNGGVLSRDEIEYLISGYVAGDIPDYQMSALAMAIYFQGMNDEETLNLTMAMVNSGETISLKTIPGIKVDKHSTGGVGDTTTIVLAPLVAAAGAPVAKLSGRGLGHTGGTLDKLEAIPGFRTDLSIEELIETVKKSGLAVAGQTGNLVPADKMLYALRDVTATVDSMPLIAGSIMSKKLAAGADALVLDVKTGDGAFLKDREKAFALARAMVAIGKGAGRSAVAVITNMEQPLGRAVGNALEVVEAVKTLRGEGPADLEEACLVLGGWMLYLAGKSADPEEGKVMLAEKISDGSALQKLKELVANQHGMVEALDDLSLLPRAAAEIRVKAEQGGYVSALKAELIGLAAMALGAGRENKESIIDPAVGIFIEKKIGDEVKSGDTLAIIHASANNRPELLAAVEEKVKAAYRLTEKAVSSPKLILGYVD